MYRDPKVIATYARQAWEDVNMRQHLRRMEQLEAKLERAGK
jgi:hypothetical protein